jgi:hypothetical protein
MTPATAVSVARHTVNPRLVVHTSDSAARLYLKTPKNDRSRVSEPGRESLPPCGELLAAAVAAPAAPASLVIVLSALGQRLLKVARPLRAIKAPTPSPRGIPL